MKFTLSEHVELVNIGHCYMYYARCPWTKMAQKYIQRYEPINIDIKKNIINDGYYTNKRLDADQTLRWKIRYIHPQRHRRQYIYFISSNKNHFLIIEEQGLKKNKNYV